MDKMIGHDPKRKKWAGGCEGGCCTTKRIQRIVKKGVKQQDKRLTEYVPETDPEDEYDTRLTMEEHNEWEDATRNWYEFQGDVYTTETGMPPVQHSWATENWRDDDEQDSEDAFEKALIEEMMKPLSDDPPRGCCIQPPTGAGNSGLLIIP